MNGGLWVNHDVNLVGAHAKEPARLDHLESFVHHRRGIIGDAVTHLPVWMRECLLWRHCLETGKRGLPKRSAGCCQHKPTHFALFSASRSEEHTSELQSQFHLVCRLLLEKKKKKERKFVWDYLKYQQRKVK